MATTWNDTQIYPTDALLAERVLGAPPFYHTDRQTILPNVSDDALSVIAPVIAYWVYSLLFHILDCSEWSLLDKFRIHESTEVKSKNLATRQQVVWAVLFQQLVQTVFGWFWLGGTSDTDSVPLVTVQQLKQLVLAASTALVGRNNAALFFAAQGPGLVWFLYWWGVPAAQLLLAMFFIDTWQYFLHRFFHVNKFLYKHIHSVHHRLYVPYAYGALYNHPLEGFLLDSVGAGIAQMVSFMSIRQAIVLFVFSTMKTIDDHCGYRLPFNPLQLFFFNNADYHDIHHQAIGIKSNFSQPFFIHWDSLLGTKMTREELTAKRKRSHEKSS